MTVHRGSALETDVSRILQAVGKDTTQQSERPVLVLTAGLPGTGKSTFSRRLAQEIDAVVIESDALRVLLFGTPNHDGNESSRLFAALHAAARELLKDGRSVIIDATSLHESDRRPVYQIAEETGTRLLLLYFTAPASVIEKRLDQRRRGGDPRDNSTAGREVYERMASRMEPPRTGYIHIDTSDPITTESALQRVVEAVRPQAAGTARTGGGTL